MARPVRRSSFRRSAIFFAAILVATAALATACAEEPLLTEATIQFMPPPDSLVGAVVYADVYRDNGGGNLEFLQSLEQEIDEEVAGVRFEIRGEDPPPATYIMRVHVDMDDNGEQNTGDYVSQDIPVFMGTYPENITVPVSLVP